MKHIRHIPFSVALVAILLGCTSAPKLSPAYKIAVVSYSLQKSIVKSGETYEFGPVLPSQQESFYRHHRESVDQAWAAFKQRAPAIFAGRNLVDFASIEGNAEMMADAAPAPRMVLGVDVSDAGQRLFPPGLSYVDLKDTKLAVKIAALAKADIIVAIDLKAEYRMTEGLSIGIFKANKATMTLTAYVTVSDASGKVLRRTSVSADSKETSVAGTIGNTEATLDPAEYPKLILSAQEELFRSLSKEISRW
jgi:hypothetical protein